MYGENGIELHREDPWWKFVKPKFHGVDDYKQLWCIAEGQVGPFLKAYQTA